MGKRISSAVAIIVIVAWSISFLVDIVRPTYDPPPTVHALMMMVAGAAVSGAIWKKDGA